MTLPVLALLVTILLGVFGNLVVVVRWYGATSRWQGRIEATVGVLQEARTDHEDRILFLERASPPPFRVGAR